MRMEVAHRSCRRAADERPRCREWILAVAGALLIAATTSAADLPPTSTSAVPSSPIPLDELPRLWEAQRGDVATAEVRFRCFNSSFEVPGNTPERVAELLAAHDLSARPDELQAFLEALTARKFDERPPWDDMVLTLSGRQRRVEGRFCTLVSDGDLEAVWTPSNRQLDLQPPGKSAVRHYGLNDLRWIPPAGVSASTWQYLDSVNGAALFDVPPLPGGSKFDVRTAIDPASGLVTHSITRYEGGDPAAEMYQSGLEVHASGIVFPRLRVDLTYADGSVYTARIMLIQEARFNETVADSAFVLPVAAGTRVVDERTAEKDVWIAQAAAADALRLPMRTSTSGAAPVGKVAAPARSAFRWWLVGVHAVGAAAAVLLVVRRRRALARSRTSIR